MTVQKTSAINQLSNISFYRGAVPPVQNNFQKTGEYVVHGNPNKPVSRNADEYAGALKGLGVYYLA